MSPNSVDVRYLLTAKDKRWEWDDPEFNGYLEQGLFTLQEVQAIRDDSVYEWGCDRGIGMITADEAKAVFRAAVTEAWSVVQENADLLELAVCQVMGRASALTMKQWLQSGATLIVYIASDPRRKLTAEEFGDYGVVFLNCDGESGLKQLVIAAGGDPAKLGSVLGWSCWRAELAVLLAHELTHALFGLPDAEESGGVLHTYDCADVGRVESLFGFLVNQRAPGWAGLCSNMF